MAKQSWYERLQEIMANNGDDIDKMFCTLPDEELHRPFDEFETHLDDGGQPFLAWTTKRVYVAARYETRIWVEVIPRHPTDDFEPDYIGAW